MTCSASCIKNNKQVGLRPLGSEHGFHLAVLAGTLFVLLRKYSLTLSLILSLAAWQLFPPMHSGLFKLMYLLQQFSWLLLSQRKEFSQERARKQFIQQSKASAAKRQKQSVPKGDDCTVVLCCRLEEYFYINTYEMGDDGIVTDKVTFSFKMILPEMLQKSSRKALGDAPKKGEGPERTMM